MMKNRTWLRIISLVLASICLISVMTAAAADLSGKVTVWDLQKAVNEGKTREEKVSVLAALLGGGDELHPNLEGQYEIWSELGLQNMRKLLSTVADKAAGYDFVLKADIDLGGKDWEPIKHFNGTFNGNNHTISNFNITKVSGNSIGFFAVVDYNGTDAAGEKVTVEVLLSNGEPYSFEYTP